MLDDIAVLKEYLSTAEHGIRIEPTDADYMRGLLEAIIEAHS